MTPNERGSFGSPVCFDLHNLLPYNKVQPFSRRVGELPGLRGSSFEFGEGIPNSWLDGFRRAKPSPLTEARSR